MSYEEFRAGLQKMIDNPREKDEGHVSARAVVRSTAAEILAALEKGYQREDIISLLKQTENVSITESTLRDYLSQYRVDVAKQKKRKSAGGRSRKENSEEAGTAPKPATKPSGKPAPQAVESRSDGTFEPLPDVI